MEYLTELKLKQNKVIYKQHSNLSIQQNLTHENIWNVHLAKFLFQARTRMMEVRCNLREKHVKEGLQCKLGCDEHDTQKHLLGFEEISESSLCENAPEYDNLFF